MGSYNEMCVISGMPILQGNAVKVIVIASVGDKKILGKGINKPHDIYVPLSLTIDGNYNDSGCIYNIKKSYSNDILLKFINNNSKHKYKDLSELLNNIVCGDFLLNDPLKNEHKQGIKENIKSLENTQISDRNNDLMSEDFRKQIIQTLRKELLRYQKREVSLMLIHEYIYNELLQFNDKYEDSNQSIKYTKVAINKLYQKLLNHNFNLKSDIYFTLQNYTRDLNLFINDLDLPFCSGFSLYIDNLTSLATKKTSITNSKVSNLIDKISELYEFHMKMYSLNKAYLPSFGKGSQNESFNLKIKIAKETINLASKLKKEYE